MRLYDFGSLTRIATTVRDLNIRGFMGSTARQRNNMIKRCFESLYRFLTNLADTLVAFIDNRKLHRRNVGFDLQRSITSNSFPRSIWISRTPSSHLLCFFISISGCPSTIPRPKLFWISKSISSVSRSVLLSVCGIPRSQPSTFLFAVSDAISQILCAFGFPVLCSPNGSQGLLAFAATRLQSARARIVPSKRIEWFALSTQAARLHGSIIEVCV